MCGPNPPGELPHEISIKTLDDCLPRYFRYACQCWIHHLKKAEDEFMIITQSMNF